MEQLTSEPIEVEMTHVRNPVEKAEDDIKQILAKLEVETGLLVKGLALKCVDLTRYSDERQVVKQSVCIETYRVPGSKWW